MCRIFGPLAARSVLVEFRDAAVGEQLLDKAVTIYHSIEGRYHIVLDWPLEGRNKQPVSLQPRGGVSFYVQISASILGMPVIADDQQGSLISKREL